MASLAADSPASSSSSSSSPASSFRYLYIPADAAETVEERALAFDPGDEVGCLTRRLSKHFARRQAPDTQAQRAQLRALLQAEVAKKDPTMTVTEEQLDRIASTQMVEVIPLLYANKENGWTAVSLYCDDSAVLKGLPMNMNATKLSVACGTPMRVMGDAFLARAQDDNRDLYRRMDITAADFAPGAPWVLEAKAFHEAKAKKEADANAVASAAAAATAAVQQAASKSAPAPRKPVSAERLAKYEEQLEGWVATKLKQFDDDEAFRETRTARHGSRAGFETWLREKKAAKVKSYQ